MAQTEPPSHCVSCCCYWTHAACGILCFPCPRMIYDDEGAGRTLDRQENQPTTGPSSSSSSSLEHAMTTVTMATHRLAHKSRSGLEEMESEGNWKRFHYRWNFFNFHYKFDLFLKHFSINHSLFPPQRRLMKMRMMKTLRNRWRMRARRIWQRRLKCPQRSHRTASSLRLPSGCNATRGWVRLRLCRCLHTWWH